MFIVELRLKLDAGPRAAPPTATSPPASTDGLGTSSACSAGFLDPVKKLSATASSYNAANSSPASAGASLYANSVQYHASMPSIYRRVLGRYRGFRDTLHWPIPSFELYRPCITGKAGIEIGGPSVVFRPKNAVPLYPLAGSIDNCDFSSNTVWANHGKDFLFDPAKPPGKSFFCEGSALTPIADASYDFLLSSHNLEHFANPLKALYEWKRALRPGGTLVLVLPYFRSTFDHRRTPTPVAAMLEDYDRNIGEDDLSHLPEILANHDLTRDPGAGTPEQFEQRCHDNINNRCLHHHVFDETNSRELLTAAGFHVLAVDIAPPIHLCLLAHL